MSSWRFLVTPLKHFGQRYLQGEVACSLMMHGCLSEGYYQEHLPQLHVLKPKFHSGTASANSIARLSLPCMFSLAKACVMWAGTLHKQLIDAA
jgi:hypothetical protein